MARLRKLSITIGLFTLALLGLLPLRAGEVGLLLPVSQAQLRLPALAPALINIDLPAAEYQVSPSSLGYFSRQNEFVFTGDEARGVIFGYVPAESADAPGGRVWLVELNTPQRAEEFLDDYLSEIRQRVDRLNTSENLLQAARRSSAAKLSRAQQLADSILSQSADELSGGGLDEWAGKVLAEAAKPANAGLLEALPEALSTRAQARAEHKKLYYTTQESRLDLRLSTFELQLALARIPRPSDEGLIGLGDEQLVRAILSGELDRLHSNWDARQQALLSGLNAQRRWLSRMESQGQQFDMSRPSPEQGSPEFALAALDAPSPLLELKRSAVQARMSVDSAELDEISRVIGALIQMRSYSQKDASPSREGLPSYSIARADFAALKLDSLPQLSQLEAQVQGASSALPLLLSLTQIFDAKDASARLNLRPAGASQSGVRPGAGAGLAPFPHETDYGLLIVDRCLREEAALGLLSIPPTSAGPPGAPPATLDSVLHAVIASPGDYGVVATDPGFLKFMQWYASLLREKLTAQVP